MTKRIRFAKKSLIEYIRRRFWNALVFTIEMAKRIDFAFTFDFPTKEKVKSVRQDVFLTTL